MIFRAPVRRHPTNKKPRILIKCKYLKRLGRELKKGNNSVTLGELRKDCGGYKFGSHAHWYSFMDMFKKNWIERVPVGSHGINDDRTIIRLTSLGKQKIPSDEVMHKIMRYMRKCYAKGFVYVPEIEVVEAAGFESRGSTGFYYNMIQHLHNHRFIAKDGSYFYLTYYGLNVLGL